MCIQPCIVMYRVKGRARHLVDAPPALRNERKRVRSFRSPPIFLFFILSIIWEQCVPALLGNASHEDFTLVCGEEWQSVLNEHAVVLPEGESILKRRSVSGIHLEAVNGVAGNASVFCAHGECEHCGIPLSLPTSCSAGVDVEHTTDVSSKCIQPSKTMYRVSGRASRLDAASPAHRKTKKRSEAGLSPCLAPVVASGLVISCGMDSGVRTPYESDSDDCACVEHD